MKLAYGYRCCRTAKRARDGRLEEFGEHAVCRGCGRVAGIVVTAFVTR